MRCVTLQQNTWSRKGAKMIYNEVPDIGLLSLKVHRPRKKVKSRVDQVKKKKWTQKRKKKWTQNSSKNS